MWRGRVAGVVWAAACQPDSRPVESGAPEAVLTAARIEAATRALTHLGPRPAGQPVEHAARDAVEALLRQAGLEPTRHAFVWSPWIRGSASITLDGVALPALALSPSPSTAGLTAPLADAGDLTDRVALFHSDAGSRGDQFSAALLGGAAAMVRITDDVDHDGAVLVEVGHTLTGSGLPCLAVDRETGARLAAVIGRDVTIDVVAEAAPGWESHNVVAELPGDDDRRPVTVTAHYDSWDTSESAIDNALGVATLALLAERAAASPRRARSIRFLVTTGEEQGLAGAFRWVADHPDDARSTALVLNLDIPWAGEGAYLVTATDPAMAAVALDAAAAEGLDPVDAGAPSPASDHLPFEQLGVPAVWITRWPDRHYHTHADLADAVDYAQAAAAARVNWAALAAAAGLE